MDASKYMRYLILILLFSIGAHAGEWRRISPDTIMFNGEITKEDVARFHIIYRPTDTKLVLNSTGGLIDPALSIGSTLIKNKKLETVVHGLCASSCANYLFLAGANRKIEGGVVGFHGNARAYFLSERFQNDLKNADPKVASEGLRKLHQIVKQEDEFFAALNLPQDLFDRTQVENDTGLYDIYVPGPNAFIKYGINNVRGEQDMNSMRSMIKNGIKMRYDNSLNRDATGGNPQLAR